MASIDVLQSGPVPVADLEFYDTSQAVFLGPELPLPEYDPSTLLRPPVVAPSPNLLATVARELKSSHSRDEEGSLYGGGAVILSLVSLAIAGAYAGPHVGVQRELNIHDLKAGVTWERVIDKDCRLQFGTDISAGMDFSLRPKVEVGGHDIFNIPGVSEVTDYVKPIWSETMTNNHSTGTVCNEKADMYVKLDEATGKIHIGFIGQNPFSVIVSPDNPSEVQYTPDPNPTAAALNLQGDQIKLILAFLPDAAKDLPGIKNVYNNSVEDGIKALLQTVALGLTQRECATVAVDEKKNQIQEQMIDGQIDAAKDFAEEHNLKYDLPRSTYVVDWPTTPVSQESGYMDQLDEMFKSKKIKLTGDDLKSVTCTGLGDAKVTDSEGAN